MANRIPITVRLDSFEGPLDLLLYLIQSHELDISKVSISKITDQFVAYVRLMQELNFDTASEFLVMAAILLHMKSKALLPQEQKLDANGQLLENELTPEDLLRQLLEHQKFLAAGQLLSERPKLGEEVFTRPNKRPPTERVWKEMNITSIALNYQNILIRARKRTQVLKKETVSLTDKIIEFRHRLRLGEMTEFSKLLSATPDRTEVVVTFLASLELARLKKARVHQEKAFSEIYLELLQSLQNLDIQLLNGFDQPGAKPAVEPSILHAVETAISSPTQEAQV